MNTAPLQPGAVLDGYEIVGLLGRGGMGVVYRARRPGIGEVALKTLLGDVTSEEADRFRREGALLAALRHPAIVPVHSAGESQGVLYFAMGIVEGESLEAKIRREGRLQPEEAARILAEVAEGVAYAHERKIVHRDLKPANVLLDAGGHAFVTDFGLGRQLGDEGDRLTRTGEILGTPWFMAPEQAFGRTKTLDERTDVYGLGAILYNALSGRPPFVGATAVETMKLVRERSPDRIEDVSPALEELVLRTLAKRPEDRPQTARDFVRELDEALHARPSLPRGLLGALVTVAVLCLVGTGALLVRVQRSRSGVSPSPSPHVSTAVERAREARDRGDLETAIRLAQDASTAKGPDAGEAALLLGDIAFVASQWSRAEIAYDRAAELLSPAPNGQAPRRCRNCKYAASLLVVVPKRGRVPLQALERVRAARAEGGDDADLAPLETVRRVLVERALADEDLDELDQADTALPPSREEAPAVARGWLAIGLLAAKPFEPTLENFKRYQLQVDQTGSDSGVVSDTLAKATRVLRAVAQARRRDPTLGPFPPRFHGFFGMLRVLVRTTIFKGDVWEKVFHDYESTFGEHPTHAYARALVLLESQRVQLPSAAEQARQMDVHGAMRAMTPSLELNLKALEALRGEPNVPPLANDYLTEVFRNLAGAGSPEVLEAEHEEREAILRLMRPYAEAAGTPEARALVDSVAAVLALEPVYNKAYRDAEAVLEKALDEVSTEKRHGYVPVESSADRDGDGR